MSLDSDLYKTYLLRIRRGNYKGIISNAKPLYVLTLLNLIEKDKINNNIIIFDENLNIAYKRMNMIYMRNETKLTPLSYPYYHLANDGFYFLQWKGMRIKNDTPSPKFLKTHVSYAYLDEPLWELLQNAEVRKEYREAIEKHYFGK